MKDALKWILIAGAGYFVYRTYFATDTTAAAAATTPAAGTPPTSTLSLQDLLNALQGNNTTTTPGTPANTPAAGNATFSSPDYGTAAWAQRVSQQMIAAAGNDSQKPDDWSFYYQNQAGGSAITPALFQGILQQLATELYGSPGDDNVTQARSGGIASSKFLNALMAAKASGLSGLGKVRIPLPPIAVVHMPNGKQVMLRGNWRTA